MVPYQAIDFGQSIIAESTLGKWPGQIEAATGPSAGAVIAVVVDLEPVTEEHWSTELAQASLVS